MEPRLGGATRPNARGEARGADRRGEAPPGLPNDLPVDPREHPIVLFDGVCNLCHAAVRFAIARDPGARLRFASLESELGRRVTAPLEREPGELDAMVLVDADGVHTGSDAALRVAAWLTWPWRWLAPLRHLPRPLREALYRFVARHRTRWFGRLDTCPAPRPELSHRFL